MERLLKKVLSLFLLISGNALLADCTSCSNGCDAPNKPITCFVPRSQSFHNELKNAVMDPDQQFLYDASFNFSLNAMFEYNQTFFGDDLTKGLFGPAAVCTSSISANTDCDKDDQLMIRIVGSQASTVTGASNPNGVTDLVADNFLLPKDFISTVTFEPSIQNFNIHLQAYFGFDEWCTGVYARIYAPITVSRWKLETCENIISAGTTTNGCFAAGEIAPVQVCPANLFPSFLSFAQGGSIPNGALPGSTTPVVVAGPTVEALKFTRFGGKCNSNTTTQLADLRAELGWNFVLDEDYHVGLYIAAAAPTANDCGDDCKGLLWGAKAGNGKHWELGGGLTAHYTICRSADEEKQFDFFLDATINHMFKHTENRTFDLKGKPLSRYIIAEKLGSITNGLNIGGTALPSQFAGAYAPVANFSTVPVGVSFPVQVDVMAKFVYTHCGFSWALGYDFWAQSCPHVELDNCNNSCNTNQFPANTWALRGDAHVYGFVQAIEDDGNFNIQPIPATSNATTAFSIGTAFESGDPANANCGVDNSAAGADTTTPPSFVRVAQGSNVGICVSNPPVFIQQSDLDICNITRGLSNSIFTEFNYTWLDYDCWVPYVGFGARVEFGSNSNSNVNGTVNATPINIADNTNGNNVCCGNCGTCTASVWGVWIRGGVSFN